MASPTQRARARSRGEASMLASGRRIRADCVSSPWFRPGIKNPAIARRVL
jgi:hypothetical protein